MNKPNKSKITLYLFLMFLFFLVLFGVSYAYFKAKINNLESVSTIAAQAGEMGIKYEGNTSEIVASDIMPSWSTTKQFTLIGKSDVTNESGQNSNMYYKIGIVVDNNTFTTTNFTYNLTKDETSDDNGLMADNISGKISASGTTYIAGGYFEPTPEEARHIYNLKIIYPETGLDQTADELSSFACHIIVAEENKLFTENINAVGYINNLYNQDATTNNLEKDGTTDDNIRYVGADPNNYVSFNNELWRVIGIFKQKDLTTKETVSKLKIVRNDSIGSNKWNSSSSNEWITSSLNTYLNNDYKKTISEEYQKMISKSEWTLGGWNAYSSVTSLNMYSYERGTTVYTGRSPYFKGDIALIYPSDYTFATNNTTCRSNINSSNCSTNNWLYKKTSYYTLTQYTSSSSNVYYVNNSYISYNGVTSSYATYPSLHLDTYVKITGGTGTSADPYTLSL